MARAAPVAPATDAALSRRDGGKRRPPRPRPRDHREALGRPRRRPGAPGPEARAGLLLARDPVRIRDVLVTAEPRSPEPEPLHRRAARGARADRRAPWARRRRAEARDHARRAGRGA